MTQVINIEWKECLKDSPKFRSVVHEQEKDIDSFETRLEKVIKHSDCIVDQAKAFQFTYNNFLAAFQSLMVHFKDDPSLLEAIGKFNESSTNWHTNYQTLLERCYGNVSKVLSSFVKTDVRRARDARKSFQRGSEDVDSAFAKNAQVSKSRHEECIEANSHLSICKNQFKKTSLDYVYELSSVQMKKKMQMLSCMSTHFASQEFFLHQMDDTFKELMPYVRRMNGQLQDIQEGVTTTKVHMKSEIEAVLNEEMNSWEAQKNSVSHHHQQPKDDSSETDGTPMEGYLYKRTSNAFKSWVRRWFVVEENQLLYCSQHRSRDGAVVLEKDLRLCNVVLFDDTERRFCFQVLSPLRCHLLQADNAGECKEWIRAIQEAARKAYNNMPSPANHKTSSSVDLRTPCQSPFRSQSVRPPFSQPFYKPDLCSPLLEVTGMPGNQVCGDCGQSDPTWASFNLGVTVCIECCGIHRSFGVHRSKVRSVILDAWEDDQVRVMMLLGNTVVNKIFERYVGDTVVARASPGCSREIREVWITEKYIKRAFVHPKKPSTNLSPTPTNRSITPTNLSPTPTTPTPTHLSNHHHDINTSTESLSAVTSEQNLKQDGVDIEADVSDWLELQIDGPIRASELLCRASSEGSLPGMLRCMAMGGEVNHSDAAGRTPLIHSLASAQLAPVEFLLLNGARVDVCDHRQQSPLHHAAILGNASQICLLLKRKANQHLKDANDQDALAIAIEKADANVVTLLRLARLNEEMRKSEGGFDNANEDMAEVFKDFSTIPAKTTNDDNTNKNTNSIPNNRIKSTICKSKNSSDSVTVNNNAIKTNNTSSKENKCKGVNDNKETVGTATNISCIPSDPS